jgi:hypothetical protein
MTFVIFFLIFFLDTHLPLGYLQPILKRVLIIEGKTRDWEWTGHNETNTKRLRLKARNFHDVRAIRQ